MKDETRPPALPLSSHGTSSYGTIPPSQTKWFECCFYLISVVTALGFGIIIGYSLK